MPRTSLVLRFLRSSPLFGILLLSGCATVLRGPKQTLIVETNPAGATVTVAGQTATTPARFQLPRKFNGALQISLAGYTPVTVDLHSALASAGGAGMAGNMLLGPGALVCATIDIASGATNELQPNPVQVTLVPLTEAPIVGAAP